MEVLHDYNKWLATVIRQLDEHTFTKEKTFSFNTSRLREFVGKETARECIVWTTFWELFSGFTDPVLYYFQILSGPGNKKIQQAIIDYKDSKPTRSVSAVKSNFSTWDTSTLYVGCCSTIKISDRVHQHLGYYTQEKTQGLQLCHWAKPLAIELQLHVIMLPADARPLATLFEKKLAKELRPLIGKHK
jgi:hypothetical protein